LTAANKKAKTSLYQVLLLDNNDSQDVQVQEGEQIDFCQVKMHLQSGGSVFITSRAAQKIQPPQSHAQVNYSRSRKTLGLLFHQRLRSQ
jgi:hypothetical protein